MYDNTVSQSDTPDSGVSEGSERTWTTVRLKKVTRDRFNESGKKGESYDDVANRMMDENDTLRAYIKQCRAFIVKVRGDPDLYARIQECDHGVDQL